MSIWKGVFEMFSMTGYGRGSVHENGRSLSIELKSVNHRFLDLSIRLPRNLTFLEDRIRSFLSSSFSRGHIDVFVNYVNERSDAKSVRINTGLIQNYLDSVTGFIKDCPIENDLTASTLLSLPDVVEIIEADEDTVALESLCDTALKEAVKGLSDMRYREGERLKNDLSLKIDKIEEIKNAIEKRAPQVITDYRDQLNARISKLIDEKDLDPQRLATEVALFADRAGIDEEIVRLSGHIIAVRSFMDDTVPVGANINFVVQEMNREVNTIGSKANDGELTALVISAKTEIEKVREQIQNIE